MLCFWFYKFLFYFCFCFCFGFCLVSFRIDLFCGAWLRRLLFGCFTLFAFFVFYILQYIQHLLLCVCFVRCRFPVRGTLSRFLSEFSISHFTHSNEKRIICIGCLSKIEIEKNNEK